MNKLKLSLISACAILATGCTTIAPQTYRDKEPNLVGKPVAERINESQTAINDQLALLERIHSGGKVGTYGVVEHNNSLDARIGSDQTVPQAYARGEKIVAEPTPLKEDWRSSVTPEPVASSVTPAATIAQLKENSLPENSTTIQNVKKIDWQNNSLNALSKNIAKALGYEVVIKDGAVADKNITFVVENKTLLEVIQQLTKEVKPFADIVVLEENKTFNIFYK